MGTRGLLVVLASALLVAGCGDDSSVTTIGAPTTTEATTTTGAGPAQVRQPGIQVLDMVAFVGANAAMTTGLLIPHLRWALTPDPATAVAEGAASS